jgi:repressor LexA
MEELTPRQASVLKFIELFIHKHQQPPAEREIAAHFRIHQSAVRKHLSALERKGKLTLRRDGRSRGIRLSDVTPAVPVPVIGSVAAGTEMLASANLERTMMLDAEFVGSEGAWLLRVHDDAMSGAGIVEGDLVMVRRTESVRNGEIVVGRYRGEVVVRRFFEIAGRIVLEPASKRHRPLTVEEPSDFQLEGRVVALIRSNLHGVTARRSARASAG